MKLIHYGFALSYIYMGRGTQIPVAVTFLKEALRSSSEKNCLGKMSLSNLKKSDMEWDVKFVLAKLLNDMKYKEAVELINAHNDNVDAQDVDIFISGFSLVYSELLNPILPILERYLSSSAISWQGRMRIALAIQHARNLKRIIMVREFEVRIRVTIDSKCKDSDDDIIEALMNGADKYFYPYCCSNEHIEHTNSTAHKVK